MDYNETKRGAITRVLRKLWMWSPERYEAMRRAGHSCEKCGVKKSVAKGKEQKLEVHHKKGEIDWDKIIKVIREELLCDPDELEALCPECHGG